MKVTYNMISIIHEAVDNKLIPGASSAFIDGGKIETDIYGLSEYPNTKLQKNMIYDIASLTKLFIAERIFQLVEEGKVNLDDTIQTHINSFENSRITIRKCLIHKTGFAPSAGGRYTMDTKRLIESVLKCEDLENSNNPQMIYSCINFIILGLLIEKIDELPLDISLEKSIFNPLGLKDTQYKPTNLERIVPTETGTKKGDVHDETARKLNGVSGNAGIFSTLKDLIKFTQYTMKNRYTELKEFCEDSRTLGWNVYNEETLYHTGFTGPIIIMKDDKKALIILTNRVHPSRSDTGYLKIRQEIMEKFISTD